MTPLTAYEQLQVNVIAGWKAEPPALIVEAMDAGTRPVVQLAEKFIPEQAVNDAIQIAYRDSEVLAHREAVAKRAQVANVRELRHVDLATCDRLADQFARSSASKAVVRGSTITGGVVVGMELSIMYALKTVHTIGFCYGFTPEDPREKQYVLQTLLVASAGSMQEKQQAIVNLHSLEDVLVEELVEDFVEEETTALIEKAIEEMAGSSIPLLGLALGGMTNFAVTSHTASVAKRVFQERWLRANHKVKTIAPDPKFARTRVQRAGSVVAACIYWPSYVAAFAVTWPIDFLTGMLPKDNAAVKGFVDGGTAATTDVGHLSQRMRGALSFEGQPALPSSATPAPAM